MLSKAYFTFKPSKILFENKEGGNRIWLRSNIKKEEDQEGNIQYSCDEAYFESRADETEVLNNFNEYFKYASSWEVPKEPTLEERLSAIEEATLYLVNAITEVTSALGGDENV